MRIFLVGGGTGGPSAPLIAVGEALAAFSPKAEFFFIGNKPSFDRNFLAGTALKMQYLRIPAGKWRRYFSLLNMVDIFKLIFGFFKSLYLIGRYKPDIIFGAGSFVQVPVAVHQQDAEPLLSTRLTAPIARLVTVALSGSAKDLPDSSGLFARAPKSKLHVTGNPVRSAMLRGSAMRARQYFHLSSDYPIVLVLGGGTGSAALNAVLRQALPELCKYVQVIHVTGGRGNIIMARERYHPYNFLGAELADAYAACDLVIARAGMSTVSELSALGKAAILVPLPDSPQEDNVRLLVFYKCAIGVFQEFFNADLLVRLTRKILWSRELQITLRDNIKRLMPKDADKHIAKLLIKLHADPGK